MKVFINGFFSEMLKDEKSSRHTDTHLREAIGLEIQRNFSLRNKLDFHLCEDKAVSLQLQAHHDTSRKLSLVLLKSSVEFKAISFNDFIFFPV